MSTVPGFLSLYEVAEALGVSHAQAARYVREGSLPGIKLGNQWLVKPQDIKSFSPPPVGNPNWHKKPKKKK